MLHPRSCCLALISVDLERDSVAVRGEVLLSEVRDPLLARPHLHVAVDVLLGLEEEDDIALVVGRELLVVGDHLEAILQQVRLAVGSVAASVRDATSLQRELGVLSTIADRLALGLLDQLGNRLIGIERSLHKWKVRTLGTIPKRWQ